MLRKWMALCALVWVAGCTSLPFQADRVNVSLSDVHIAQAGVVEQIYALKLRVQNPNAHALDVQGLSYDMEINGRRFARGVSPKSFLLPAFGETQIEVTAVSSISTLIEQLTRFRQDKPKALRYRLTGNLNMPGKLHSDIPFEYSGEVALSALAPQMEGLDRPVEH